MNLAEQKRALACAIKAAHTAGNLMRRNLHATKKVNSAYQHDIKLELDVRCQKLIERILRTGFPRVALLGEEGISGDPKAAQRWVVDPIDGTVNFAYGIPHACVSIALQTQSPKSKGQGPKSGRGKLIPAEHETVVGVVYDPFNDELWTAIRGQPARLNGRIIRVSQRGILGEAIVSIGFAKTAANLERTLPYFGKLVR